MASDTQENGIQAAWGILFLAAGVFLGLSLLSYDWRDISLLHAPPNRPPSNFFGPIGAWLSYLLFMGFGLGAYVIPAWGIVFGTMTVLGKQERLGSKALWAVAFTVALSCIFELYHAAWADTRRALNLVDAGGILGYLVMTRALIRWLSPVGSGIIVWGILVGSAVVLVTPRNILRLGRTVGVGFYRLYGGIREFVEKHQDERRRIEREARKIERRRRRLEQTLEQQERRIQPVAEKQPKEEPVRERAPVSVAPEKPPQKEKSESRWRRRKPAPARNEPKPVAEEKTVEPPTSEDEGSYVLPPITLLDETPVVTESGSAPDTAVTAKVIVETLIEFGIEAEVTNIEKGPVVTRYEVLPAPGVRVERISGLSNNIALSLKATSVRIQAPIPGKGVVGIEVPNTSASAVSLRHILEGDLWKSGKARLPLVLGKDVGGNDLVADLTDMPHLLIAGATGAGKTVCMNSVLAGLLMSRSPEQLKLLLVDPKIVEFSAYGDLPHLVVPVVTDPKKVAIGLRWAINEMEKRYKMFARAGVRNIEAYNNRVVAKQTDLFGGEEDTQEEMPEKVPYIVIVIDELADLMLANQAEIENCIARLAQLSRAVGIHMILSTQRPSVNVITGTIKANFPARIAFQVAQKVDSRTILDRTGADKLLGRGDMLFLPPGSSKLVRAQGAMTTDDEIRRIVEFIKDQQKPSYELEIKKKLEKSGAPSVDDGEDDELLSQAVEIIRETQRASTSSLQRRLRIGYTRAARIMDILQERGVVGPPRGSDPREILVDLDAGIPDNEPEERTD